MIPASVREFRKKHERLIPIVFFGLGFGFDALMLRRIDELATIIQQAIYILLAGALIGAELLETTRELHPPFPLRAVWKHREAFLHFMLGTLLNSYTIFYSMSASAFTSYIFIFLLVGLLMFNEFVRVGKSQTQVHMALWGLCLVSYLASLVPILIGHMGTLPFLVAVAASALIFWLFQRLLRPGLAASPELWRTHLLLPFAATQVLFTVLYFTHLVPPIPLSVKYMGIYHDVKKKEGEYELTFTRSRWKFWQHGDQTFLAKPGDTIFCYVQIFSPARFHEELQIRWLYYDARRGWLPSDAIPLPIVGGREEGYRAITKKSNYQPGEWRVQVETRDGREVGRIGFDVEAAGS